MDHILRDHPQPHGLADWHVQLINLTAALRMINLPHPLLANHLQFDGALGRCADLEKQNGSPEKHHHGERQWNQNPSHLQEPKLLRVQAWAITWPAVAVFDGEVNNGDKNR